MEHEDVIVRPIDEVPWDDARIVFGTRGDPSTCWCQFFKMTNAEWSAVRAAGRANCLQSQVTAARERGEATPGLVAYVGSEPVGWVAVEPRTHYPQALRGRVVTGGSAEAPDDESVWAITCFVVRVGFRRRGIAGALVAAATNHARGHGARVIEGYPVDTAAKEKVSSSELYHGSLTLFEGAGFTVMSRPVPGRALVTFTV
jgi:ribosomal protein S18 acetylase RimI-like enzyme